MVKALVTGGAGFIGSHLAEMLAQRGHQVVVADNFLSGRPGNLEAFRDRIDIRKADITDRNALHGLFDGVDWVFHLAALADIVPSIQQPEAYFETNVRGTFNVLEAARDARVSRFVYAASSSCYGIATNFPTSEVAPTDPRYPYALTKYLGEQLVMHWSQVYGLPALSLRLFNVYGPRSRTTGAYGAVFGVFIAQLLAGKPLTIVGDGEQTRDFTYVTDIADAFITAAASNRSNEIFNVGSGRTVSVNRLVELLGAKDIVHIPKRPGEPDCTFGDIAKISRELNWAPRVAIEEGVPKMLQHAALWRDAPVWTPESIAVATQDWFKYLGQDAAHE